MKKYIIIALIGGFTIPAFAQEQKRDSLPDMVQLGYQTETPQKAIAGSTRSVNSKVLDKAPEIDSISELLMSDKSRGKPSTNIRGIFP